MTVLLATLIFTTELAALALVLSGMIAGLVWLRQKRFRQPEQD